jgi:hypothetical protein
MIKQFQEIDEFFKREQFSEIELEDFKSDFKKKYRDKTILKHALCLISMKLLVFSMKPVSNKTHSDFTQNQRNTLKNKTPKNSDLKKKDKLVSNFEARIKEELNSFNGKTISYVANSLGYTVPKFSLLLKQKGFNFKDGDFLTKVHIQQIEPFLLECLKKLYREKLKDKPKLNPNSAGSKKKSSSVYDELKAYGPGKLIYIRSK